jgi:XapX domain-containing protein
MNGAVVSFVMGLAVGMAYALLNIRSPAPPIIALVGLLGMVLGEQMVIGLRSPPAPAASSAAPQAQERLPTASLPAVDRLD